MLTILVFLAALAHMSMSISSIMKLRSGRIVMKMSTSVVNPLQGMHDSIASVLDMGKVLRDPWSSSSSRECLKLMSDVSLSDVGLEVGELRDRGPTYCMNIVQKETHDITVFVIPKGNCIPLHDHPGMLVASKLLHGELEVESFSESHSGLYKSTREVKTHEHEAWYLTPSEGNFHQFKALSTCIVLDLLMPPYDDKNGRACTFYKKRRAEGLYWQLAPMPSWWTPDQADCVYNGDNYYKGFKPKTN